MMMRILFLMLCVALVSSAGHAQVGQPVLKESFENDEFQRNWKSVQACCSYSLQRSNSVSRDGGYSLRVELNNNDPLVSKGRRAELATGNIDLSFEKWSYSFSTYLPSAYPTDNSYEIVAQWHEVADAFLGEQSRTPPISLQINNGRWILSIRWATDPVNTNQSISGSKRIDLGAAETNIWADWKFVIYFSYNEDGHLEIWKNNQLFAQYDGPNYYNDKRGPYFKIGLYKSQWTNAVPKVNISRRIIYIDNIVIDKSL